MIIRTQLLAVLEDDWDTYMMRFHLLPPDRQEFWLARQGYARFADLLAHIIAWWAAGLADVAAMVADPDYRQQDYDVDAFNARAVAEAAAMGEATVIEQFESQRVQWLMLVTDLTDEALATQQIADRLQMELIGHLKEHQLPM